MKTKLDKIVNVTYIVPLVMLVLTIVLLISPLLFGISDNVTDLFVIVTSLLMKCYIVVGLLAGLAGIVMNFIRIIKGQRVLNSFCLIGVSLIYMTVAAWILYLDMSFMR